MNGVDSLYGIEEHPPKPPVSSSPARESSIPEVSPSIQSFIPGLGRLGDASITLENTSKAVAQPVVAEEIEEAVVDPSAREELSAEMSGMECSAAAPERHDFEIMDMGGENSAGAQEPHVCKSMDIGKEDNATASAVHIATVMDVDASESNKSASEPCSTIPAPERMNSNGAESRPITHALEALLGGLDNPATKTPNAGTESIAEEPVKDEIPEWEVDSSPYESSSDDSSSDESSEEDSEEDGENVYKLLSPEEQARILMEGDGGSDDEGGTGKTKGTGGQLRTKNEIAEEIIPKPDVTITPEMRIEELGQVETIVENIILIKAKISGEYKALESGSVLCLADRGVIGVISETLGRVQQPLYTVRFTNGADIIEAGLLIGTKIFFSVQHATFALTQALKAYKGSDASNLHDEEVGDEEVEFSDDEAEAEHKRRLKQKKMEKWNGKMQQSGGQGRAGPHGHPLQQQHLPTDNGGLIYDDLEDDGPYKPLPRPTGFADMVGRREAPQEGIYMHGNSNRSRGDFQGRGRSDRGRPRGDRGRRRGGLQDRRDHNAYSQATQGPQQNSSTATHILSPYGPPAASSQSPIGPPNPNIPYSPQQPLWPQYSQQPFQQPFLGFPQLQSGWPTTPAPLPFPSGAFINPAFFAGNQQGAPNQWQQGRQDGRSRGSSS